MIGICLRNGVRDGVLMTREDGQAEDLVKICAWVTPLEQVRYVTIQC